VCWYSGAWRYALLWVPLRHREKAMIGLVIGALVSSDAGFERADMSVRRIICFVLRCNNVQIGWVSTVQ
jgi:hypothetical protein